MIILAPLQAWLSKDTGFTLCLANAHLPSLPTHTLMHFRGHRTVGLGRPLLCTTLHVPMVQLCPSLPWFGSKSLHESGFTAQAVFYSCPHVGLVNAPQGCLPKQTKSCLLVPVERLLGVGGSSASGLPGMKSWVPSPPRTCNLVVVALACNPSF